MADIRHEIPAHLAGLFHMGDVLERDHDRPALRGTDPAHEAAMHFVDRVLRPVASDMAGLSRDGVDQPLLDQVDDLGLAQDGGIMAPDNALAQKGQPCLVRGHDPFRSVHQQRWQRHGAQELVDHLVHHDGTRVVTGPTRP